MHELNVEEALARLGGDRDLLAELAGMFVDQLPELLEATRTGVAGPDTTGGITPAHTLKGLLAQFGAGHAHLCARDVELACRENRADDARAACTRLEAACQAVAPQLEALAGRREA